MKKRLYSLDVFRGIVVMLMILVNNPGNWDWAPKFLCHADWHGWRLADTIFPTFLFMVGVSLVFSCDKRIKNGDGRDIILSHVAKRASELFLIGLFLNFLPSLNTGTIRIFGVLQRIAICYAVVAFLELYARPKIRFGSIPVILIGYSVLLTGGMEMENNFVSRFDRLILGNYAGASWGDSEGILSTIPAIATTLIGLCAGYWIKKWHSQGSFAAYEMMVVAIFLFFSGLVLGQIIPVNKILWTPSFVILMGGLSLAAFAAIYWLVDVRGLRVWTISFVPFGRHALFVYFVSEFLSKSIDIEVLGNSLRGIWFGYLSKLTGPSVASSAITIAFILFSFAVAYGLEKRPRRAN